MATTIYGNPALGLADQESIVQGNGWRFTVLTERMIRMEYSANNEFVDKQTQIVVDRRFPVPEFSVNERENKLEIITKYLIVTYDKKEFSGNDVFKRVKVLFDTALVIAFLLKNGVAQEFAAERRSHVVINSSGVAYTAGLIDFAIAVCPA